MSPDAVRILRYLIRQLRPATVGELAIALELRSDQVRKALRPLEAQHWVRIRRRPDRVGLTPKGLEQLERAQEAGQ